MHNFLSEKRLVFKINHPEAKLVVRDIKGTGLQERDDEAIVDSKTISLPYDKALMFTFKIQSKKGRPIKAYY